MDEKKKYIIIAIAVVIAVLLVLVIVNYSAKEEPIPLGDISSSSNYDAKLKDANDANKIQGDGLFNVKDGYFEPDSILQNGALIESPKAKERREVEKEHSAKVRKISNQSNEALQQLVNGFNGSQDEWYEERVQPNKTPKVKSRTPTQISQTKTQTQSVTYDQVESKKQRKQAMEESFDNNANGSLDCVVYRTQEVGAGQLVSLRVTNTCTIGSLTIPKNTVVFASLKFDQNRAKLQIGSLKLNGKGYAVSMSGYGEDGGEGIPLSISITKKEVDKEVTNSVVSEAQNMLGQVAGVGGKLVGNVIRSVSRSSQKETERKITLIDKQKITFIPEY